MLEPVLDVLATHDRFVLTTHRRPDGDAIGSVLALGRFLEKKGKSVYVLTADPTAHNLTWMAGAEDVAVFSGSLAQRKAIATAEVALVLDTNAEDRLGKAGKPIRASGAVKVLIDHHTHPEGWFDVVYRREDASSTGELVYEIITAIDADAIDRDIAAALYTAIMTDTGSFRFSNVTPRIHRIIADLLERGGINPDDIHGAVYDTRSVYGLRLMGRAFDTLRLLHDGVVGYMVISQRMLEETGADRDDTEGLVNYILSIEGTKAALLFIESEAGVKVSFRSKGAMHVHTWAQAFGGGGHRNASGAYQKGTLDDVIRKILDVAPRYLDLGDPSDEIELTAEDDDLLAMFKQKAG